MSKKIKSTIILILICILSTKLYPDIKFHHLGFEDGLSQFSIRSLYQDELGAIWLATNEDIKRYNGNRFEEIDINLGKNTNYRNIVYFITGDKKGKLYFKTDLNSVIEYDNSLESSKMIFQSTTNATESFINYGNENLWIAQDNKIYKYSKNKLGLFKTISNSSLKITSIFETKKRNLLIGTQRNGLYLINQNGNELNIPGTATSEITCIFEDSKNRIWIGTWNSGVFLMENNKIVLNINKDKNEVKYSLSNNFIRAICEDDEGNLWVGTANGLNKIETSKFEVTHYGIKNTFSLNHPSIWSIIKDKQGTLWAATYYGGLKYFNPSKEVFTFTDFTESSSANKYPIISKIIEDKYHNLWISTETKGLIYYNAKKDTYRYYNEENNSISRNIIKSMYYDSIAEILWIGTHLGGLNKFDIKQQKASTINIKQEHDSYSSQSIQTIVAYKNYLFLGTLSGIIRYNKLTGLVDKDSRLGNNITIVKHLVIDKNDKMWIATNGLYSFDLKTGKLEDYKSKLKYSNFSIQTQINKIFIDPKNRLWLGTNGAGVILFQPDKNKIKEYNTHTIGIESNYISAISITNSGIILAATSKGVSFIDEKNSKCFNYNLKNGFPILSMLNGNILRLSNGNIAFGGVNGVSYLNEELLKQPETEYNIRFDKLLVNNKVVKPNDETGILTKTLCNNKSITLNQNQKLLAIEIASDNYLRKNQPNFQYRIKNYSNEWTNFDIKTPISIMNLLPGNYSLQVRKTILNEIDTDSQIELQIIMKPPFYASWYAYLLYVIALIAIVIWILSFYRSRLMLQTSLLFERKDKEQKELANQSKLRFFTNISHEFRTPITLIIGQLELLLQSTKIATSHYKDIVNIHRNALKMTRLINELLDFRKQEQGFMKLKVSEKNIIDFLRDIYTSFIDYAASKKIELEFKFDLDIIPMWYDYLQLQKVFFNLLSNAFKFTDKNGSVKIEVVDFVDKITVSIIDTGHGIAPESISKVFEQFYQYERESTHNVHNPGTGLGLALSKGIVELHGGQIEVTSEVEKGSCFTVTLLKGNAHLEHKEHIEFVNSEYENIDYNVEFNSSDIEFIEEATVNQKEHFENMPFMLIVEDDSDLRNVLVKIFSPMYKILEADNGVTGFDIAKEKQPDLIISDIMMPKMNGNEMCSKLKNDFETCHIPVILLTAQSTVEQNIDGLKSGADDYISKPFNVKILIMRCNNLLISRKTLQEKYTKQIEVSPNQITHNIFDQKFIEKAVSIIEQNARYKRIDVDFLCSEMAIGRRVFFNKMKSITGQTPNDFILTVKFKLAASMLKNNPELNISEISDALGFSSSKYFGKCFREQFGISPSQMREELS
jgi:signal transduction histidine kinase/ligand-binding sensor domain-containing protein/CheY-like chemotaxis protein